MLFMANCCLPGPPAPTFTSPSLQSTTVQRSLFLDHSPLQAPSGNKSELLSIAIAVEVVEIVCLPDVWCGLASAWLHNCG